MLLMIHALDNAGGKATANVGNDLFARGLSCTDEKPGE